MQQNNLGSNYVQLSTFYTSIEKKDAFVGKWTEMEELALQLSVRIPVTRICHR